VHFSLAQSFHPGHQSHRDLALCLQVSNAPVNLSLYDGLLLLFDPFKLLAELLGFLVALADFIGQVTDTQVFFGTGEPLA